jgi:CubicO group peptidase (beta-lactamase class C family)
MLFRALILIASSAAVTALNTTAIAETQPPPDTASPAVAASTDTPETTPSGATFTQPQSWTLERHATFVVLNPPEPDTHVAIVDVASATDATDAASKAWTQYRAGANRPVKLITPDAAREGWDERQIVFYETSPNEKATVWALASRSKSSWSVMILDASDATAEKRDAAITLILESLRPAGYQRETFAGRKAHPLDKARIEAIKSFLRTAMEQLDVPGVGLALVEHGKVVFEGGIGVRELGKPDVVDAHTLFMIASNTKGMSTLLLAQLVDQHKLRWDQPVTDVYPAFRLGSTETTQKVLIRHLVCACTGLPRKDMEWLFNTSRDTPATSTFTLLAATEPTSGFGEVFQYNNLMASAAGYIGAYLVYPDRELDVAYDAAMQTMIFNPLGMNDTTFDMSRALAANHASPHAYDVDGKARVVPMDPNYAVVPYRPAGGAWSSAHDMIRYVENELTLGKLKNGSSLVSKQNLLKRREATVSIGEDGWYGMGLEVDRSYGVEVVHHGGSLFGYKSDWYAVPDAGVGAVVLTNADEGWWIRHSFMRRLLEVLYDGRAEAADELALGAAGDKAWIKKERERLVIPAAAEAVAQLATRYTNADLGHIDVSRNGNEVLFDFGLWKSHVGSRNNDDGTISFVTIDAGMTDIAFVVTQHDGKRALILRDSQHEYMYVESSA